MSIYIFSRPIHSGKTTELLTWCNDQQSIAGILMPDIDGSRKIYNIETKEVLDIQCIDLESNKAPLTTVGRFNFYTEAFEKANALLLEAIGKKPTWLIIDEAGKLELDRKGFYPALESIIEFYKNNASQGNLLIAVRESLCVAVISFFEIAHCKVIRDLNELDQVT